MEEDIKAVLNGRDLPLEGDDFDLFLKSWKESQREAIKSEYAFRYNYNYYLSPQSMYRYKPSQDAAVDAVPWLVICGIYEISSESIDFFVSIVSWSIWCCTCSNYSST